MVMGETCVNLRHGAEKKPSGLYPPLGFDLGGGGFPHQKCMKPGFA